MENIIVSFTKVAFPNQIEINKQSSSTSFVSWHRLKSHIAQEIGLQPNEEIMGIVANESGVKVYLKHKE